MSASRFPQFRHPVAPCISNRPHFYGSLNFVTCHLRQVYDSSRVEAENRAAILAANDNLEIFLGHSTPGRSNFHAAPILDLQFRPPAEQTPDFQGLGNSTGGRNIALLNLSFFAGAPLSSFLRAHPTLSTRAQPVLPFSSSFPPHLHPR